jgi:PAS domain S-box-containing protein
MNQSDQTELANLVHELRVKQIELEAQNKDLRCSILELETTRNHYSRLYDFAPVAYFTLGTQNFIKEANLTGTNLLGLARSKLVGNRFTKYVSPDTCNVFYYWRKRALDTGKKETCELGMIKADGTQYFAQLAGIADKNKQLRVAVVDISERKIADEKRLESEARYHSLFDEARDGIVIIDAQTGDITECNSEFERQTGKSIRQLTKLKIWNINPHHMIEHGRKVFLKTNKSGQPNTELIFQKPDGTNRIVEPRAKKIRYKGQDYFQYICRDITRTREIELGLEKSNQKLTTILNSISEGFFTLEDGLLITSFNDAAKRLLGIQNKVLAGQKFLEALPEFRDSIFEEKFRYAQDTKTPVAFETFFSIRPFENWYDVRIYPYDNGIAVFFWVTTEKKRSDAREVYLATFPQFNPNPVIELSAEGEVLYLNPSSKRLFPDLAVGQHFEKHAFFSCLGPMIKSNILRSEPLTCEAKVNNCWYHQSVQMINERVRIYSFDITERKKTEALKDEFIGMVSHELKTPMTVIIGALSTLTMEGLTKEDARELLNDAVNNASAMTDMIENLLELSRNQASRLVLEINPTDIYAVVQKVVKKLREKSVIHRFVVDMPPNIPLIHSDSIRLERILNNLTDNAIKYSPQGGEVNIFVLRKNCELLIGVKDHGIGMSPEDQEKVFQSFWRVGTYDKQSIQGIGMGLRVCQILVEALGGTIWLDSKLGEGSTFFFTIPLKKTSAG